MFGLGLIFLVSLCTLIFSVVNRLKGRNDLRVFEEIRSGKDDDDDQEISRSFMGVESDVVLQSELIASTSKYEFISGKDVRGFLKEPGTKRFTVQELFVCSEKGLNLDYGDTQFPGNNLEEKVATFNEDSDHSPVEDDEDHFIHDSHLSSDEDAPANNDPGENSISVAEADCKEEAKSSISVAQVNDQEKAEETISVAEVNDQEKAEETISVAEVNDEVNAEDSTKIQCYEEILEEKEDVTVDEDVCYQIQSLPEDQPRNEEYETAHKDFLLLNNCEKREELEEEECLDQESVQSRDKTADVDEGFTDSNPPLQNSSHSRVTEHNMQSEEMRFTDEYKRAEVQQMNQSFWDSDSDEDDELDILLQHQNLVQQIKMEMRNSRMRCLPTISEECETPKMADDLKPLKIDEKLEYKDRMEEIQKFYKCYAEKMRKLDILNYQTLNAISFIQLKDSETFTLGKKSLFSSNKLLPLPSLRGNKLRRIYVDQTHKSISELSHNLELVYVGQACLSWEILCWQYGKTKELLEYDARGHHAYNHVAGEYQQFQVLLQRFVEDEPYQGHRLQYYAKNRCILRSFLQVPALKDDCSKEKKVGCEEETDCISLVKLSEIINKTMHTFWEFLHADKDEASLAVKGHSAQVDPADTELLMDVTTTHQKKERKLKEIQRSGNCIVKKFQKQQEGRVNENRAVFICRVELRLVAKVLGLPRLTRDHLVWCKKKLNNINIVGRKVSVEPSCLLFPC